MPTADEIDDRIALWHHQQCRLKVHEVSETIHEALGWTPEEYRRWVLDPKTAPGRPLPAKCKMHLPSGEG